MYAFGCNHGVALKATHVLWFLLGLILLIKSVDAQEATLLRQTGTALRGGNWGFIKDAQEAISTALSRCGSDGIEADGTFGRKSRAAVTLESRMANPMKAC